MNDAMTNKQRSIYDFKQAGKTNKEIAGLMGCSENVVRKQLTAIYKRLGIRGGTDKTHNTLMEVKQPEQAAALMDAATDPFASVVDAIREAGLPQSTGEAFLRRLRTKYRPVNAAVKSLKTHDIIRMLDEKIGLVMEFMDEKVVAEASFRDLALGGSALLEKRNLLKGEPTQILSDDRRKSLNELLPKLVEEARRRGITLDGEARLVQDTER